MVADARKSPLVIFALDVGGLDPVEQEGSRTMSPNRGESVHSAAGSNLEYFGAEPWPYILLSDA